VRDTDADAALVFYLTKADPLLVLRDLLGHSSVLVTEKYLKRLPRSVAGAARRRKQVLLFNIATLVTVVIGVTVLYVALYLLALVAAFWFVVPKIFRDAVGHPVSLRD